MPRKSIAAQPASMPDEDDYRARSDANTLMEAEEIKGDKDRHAKAQTHVRKRFHTAARAMAKKGKGNRFTARAKLQGE